VRIRSALLTIAAATLAATLGVDAPSAEESTTSLSPQALQEIAQVEAEIDRIEAQTIERLAAPPNNQVQQVELLGKLLLYDKALSVNRNEACAFCHMPETGFTGPGVRAEPDYRLLSRRLRGSRPTISRRCQTAYTRRSSRLIKWRRTTCSRS
jgi:cytochrome c peroxidase